MARGLSPAMRAFLVVDVVLVLAFFAVLLLTRGTGGPEQAAPPPSPTVGAAASSGTGTDAQDATDGAEESPEQEPDEPQLFASPSGNIVCSLSPDAASCSISAVNDGALVEDEDCAWPLGHVVRVTADGTVERPCLEDAPGKAPSGTPVLDYEESTSAFGFTCTSSRSGVICRHEETGHGFSIARAGSSLF